MAYEDRSYSGNAVPTTVAANFTNVATTFQSLASTGYPDGTGGPFAVQVGSEVIRCSSRAGTTFTVQTVPVSGRGWDGTTAAAHIVGEVINHVYTATDADESNQHIANTGLDHHSQYLTVARHDLSARHGFANLPVGGTPSTSLTGDTAQNGTSSLLPRSDHKHAREGFGSPVTAKATGANGAAITTSRSDHVHAGGIQIVANAAARPASPIPGEAVIEADTRRLVTWGGSAWRRSIALTTFGRTGAYVLRQNPYGPVPDGGASSYILPWDTEIVDSDGYIPAPDGTTTTAITCPYDEAGGLFIVSVYFQWAAIIGARSYIEIYHTFAGPATNQHRVPIGIGEDRGIVSTTIEFAAGDTIQLGMWQNSGAPVSVAGVSMQCWRLFS